MGKYLVVYNTLGFPSIDRFLLFLKEARNRGVDFFEIGIPPRFAKYDGPVIRRSYSHVKSFGIDVWEVLKTVRKNIDLPLIVLTYLDDYIENLGMFVENLHTIEIDYVLFPDLLIDYVDRYQDIVKEVKDRGLKVTLFVSPSMPDKLVAEVSLLTHPFLYYGLRPATGIPIPIDPVALVKRARRLVNNTLVVGFGLSINDIANVLRAGADGVAIGTVIVEALENSEVNQALKIIETVRGVLDGL
ncbi:MAG: tryptophan synthase subunit alpha [Ignisphaera sp.]|uniref:tryptophan synthase n=1 Tax=Ignisphaera aggregans TaxID=334771 RepID=A0A7C4GZ41_9CREN